MQHAQSPPHGTVIIIILISHYEGQSPLGTERSAATGEGRAGGLCAVAQCSTRGHYLSPLAGAAAAGGSSSHLARHPTPARPEQSLGPSGPRPTTVRDGRL